LVISLLAIPQFTVVAHASQVFTAIWQKFNIEASGMKISGTEDKSGITSLKIKAFNRTYILNKEQLNLLKGTSANGVSISGETGWKGQGGMSYAIILKLDSEDDHKKGMVISVEEESNDLKINPWIEP
jgi:hypothetical protein